MLQEIALDKARIARIAYGEWAGTSTNWLRILDRGDLDWFDLEDLVMPWLGKHLPKAMGMTEAELTRAVKRYLTSWAQGVLRKAVPVPEVPTTPTPIEWAGMVDDLNEAERMARRKAGKKNLTPWVAPRGQATVGGEVVDFTSHEFWSDMYMYAIENPERIAESHTAFLRRMGDAGADAKMRSERMPQPHNGYERSYSLSASSSQSVAAGLDGKFDRDHQTLNRPIGLDRRPMDLRDESAVEYPVTLTKVGPDEVGVRRLRGRIRFATEPIRS
jgi:hypothetical protein